MLVLTRLLGPDGYGLLFLAVSVLSVVQIFSMLGLAKSGARYISEFRERNPGQVPYIVSQTIQYTVVTTVVTLLLFFILHEEVASVLSEPELAPLLKVGLFFVAFESMTRTARYLAQGFEDIPLASALKAANHTGRLLLATAFVLLGFDVYGAFVGFVLSSMIVGVYGLVTIYRRHYKPTTPSDTVQEGLPRRILKYNLPLAVTNLSGKIDKQIDTILVGYFLNPVAVGYYVLAKQVVTFIEAPAHAVGFSTSPTYGKNKAAGDIETPSRIFEESLVHTLLLYIPAAVGLAIVARPTVTLIFGDEYTGAVPVLQVLSLYVVLLSIIRITDYPLDYLGRARERAIIKGLAAVSNALLNIALIPLYDVVGAAIATVITSSFYVIAQLYVTTTELRLNSTRIVSQTFLILFVTAGMGVVVFFASTFIHGLLSLFAVIALGIVIWLGLSLVTGLLTVDKLLSVT